MTNNQKIIILCLLPFLFILLMVIFRPLPTADSDVKINSESAQTFSNKSANISKAKETFYNKYAFDASKSPELNYITFTGLENSVMVSFTNFLSDFSSLKIDFSAVQEDYEKLSVPAIYRPQQQLKNEFSTIYIEYAENESQLKTLAEENIKFDYVLEIKDAYLSAEDVEINQLLGDLIRNYYLKLNEIPFVNLGAMLSGNLNLDKSVSSATLNLNIDKPLDFEAYLNPEKIDLEEIESLILNRKGRIYKLDNLGTSYVSENPDLQEFGFKPQSVVKIEQLSVEYFYLKEENLAVPLLKLSGSAEDKAVAFWLWFIK